MTKSASVGVRITRPSRLRANAKFFETVWYLQPRCMALFGPQVEETFMKLHQARRLVEVAAQMLYDRARDGEEGETQETQELYEKLRRDLWDTGSFEPGKDRVGKLLNEFAAEVVAFADPVVKKGYRNLNVRPWK